MKTMTWMMMAGVLAGILLAGCQGKTGAAADKAAGIADFSVPQGYQAEMALDLAGYTVVSYNPGDGHSHLYLVQAPTSQDVTPEKLEAMLSQTKTGQKDKNTRLTVVEKRPATIRGQAATLVISEGTNSDGDAYRQVTAAFQGKGGPALLVLEEPVDRWDEARVDQLIASFQ
jgi:hypothetical protein